MIGFVFSLCLLFRWGILHKVLLVVGWCWVLYSSGFLCVSSRYLMLPSYFSDSLGSWRQWSHSKGSELDLWSGTKIPQVVCYGIKWDKTNIPKWETKDEPQTNGSYKIRQIIIKIMEYTHVCIYPWAKSKQPNKYKVQQIYPAIKVNQKIIFTS